MDPYLSFLDCTIVCNVIPIIVIGAVKTFTINCGNANTTLRTGHAAHIESAKIFKSS